MTTTSLRPTGPEPPELDVRVVEDAHALRRLAADMPPGASMIIVVGATSHARLGGAELGTADVGSDAGDWRQLAGPLGALLQRAACANPEEFAPRALHLHALVLDPGARTVRRGDQPLALTATEFDLLHAFMRHAGRVVSRDELSRAALGRSYQPPDRSVDMHVSNLRKKLAAAGGAPWLIKSVRSRGYLMPPGGAAERLEATGNRSTGG